MAWDSNQYLKFAKERQQPCLDLLARLNGDFGAVLDLGCGPGNSTRRLCEKYKNATVTGFDADDNMLERAKKECPTVEFVKGFAPGGLRSLNKKFDLVFSNACIHWVEEQAGLIKTVSDILIENGVFAVQIPLTDESHFYRILYRLIDEKYPKLKSVRNFHALTAEGYYNGLSKHFSKVTVWRSDYYHTVASEQVLEWYKGSGLRPYLAALGESEGDGLLSDLRTVIRGEYPVLSDGNVFLIMPRLFFVAEK